MSRGPNWTREDYERVVDLLAKGFSKPAIAELIGKTLTQVRHKIVYESMTGERREQIRERVNASRRAVAAGIARTIPRDASRSQIFEPCPAAVFAERARRQSAEHPNYTAEFFGDPKPGFSALDRKLGALA